MVDFALRWVFAFVLVVATYNPTQWNYTRWALNDHAEQTALVVFLGLVLAIGYIIYIRATLRSIGPFGMLLVAALFGSLIWVLFDFGLLSLENRNAQVWLGLFALSLVLGVGLSWSIIRRRLSGQVDMDDIDEEQ
jgi:Na+/melibiose symporter-like transporter